jgi:hypothetical protein
VARAGENSGEELGRRLAWERHVGAVRSRRWSQQGCSGGERRRRGSSGGRQNGVARRGGASRGREAVGAGAGGHVARSRAARGSWSSGTRPAKVAGSGAERNGAGD